MESSLLNLKKKSSNMQKTLVKFNNLTYECIELTLINTIEYEQQQTESQHSSDVINNNLQYGFVIAGYCPCHVESVNENGLAFKCGLRKDDLLMKVNDVSCCRAALKTILSLIKNTKPSNGLKLTVYRNVNAKTSNYNHYSRKQKLNSSNKYQNSTSYQKMPKKSTTKRIKLLSKLFKPSLWLTCAQPMNQVINSNNSNQFEMKKQNLNNSTFYYYAATNNNNVTDSNTNQINDNISKSKINTDSNLLINDYILCERDCCKKLGSVADTGYETLSRYNDKSSSIKRRIADEEELTQNETVSTNDQDYTIETITNTLNSYSQCDLTAESVQKHEKQKCQQNFEKFNEQKTQLIGHLIEMEANFVSYLGVAVATFSRPLRGFFIQQQDYFRLFQNIEKILIISENFLRSMDKWSAFDLYTRIGQLYTQKLSLFRDAFSIYFKGHAKSKALLNELKSHSKQFRLFLKETQSYENQLTLSNLLDMPLVHLKQTLELFKQIRKYTPESKRNPTEAPHIDSIILELKNLLQLANVNFSNQDEEEEMELQDEIDENQTTFFMPPSTLTMSSINNTTSNSTINYEVSSCCSSESSSSSDSTLSLIDYTKTTNYDSFYSSVTNICQ